MPNGLNVADLPCGTPATGFMATEAMPACLRCATRIERA